MQVLCDEDRMSPAGCLLSCPFSVHGYFWGQKSLALGPLADPKAGQLWFPFGVAGGEAEAGMGVPALVLGSCSCCGWLWAFVLTSWWLEEAGFSASL